MLFQAACIFPGKAGIGYNGMDFAGIEQVCNALLAEFIRGGERDDLVCTPGDIAHGAAAGVIQVGKAVFFGEAIDADEELVHMVFAGAQPGYGPGGYFGNRIVVAAQQHYIGHGNAVQGTGDVGGIGDDGGVLYADSSVGYKRHLETYKQGVRTPID